MKLARYGNPGREQPALIDAQGRLRDLSAHIPDITGSVLLPDTLARLRALDVDKLPLVEGSPRYGACIADVGKIICVGLNYSDHAAESNMAVPTEPVLFMKPSSSIVGPNDDVEIPPGSEKTDWEVELG
ncbi:MAG: fumarylacetoacetate hydrolase family protein, partial [Solimonas sp.]